jgi:DNA repair protein RecO
MNKKLTKDQLIILRKFPINESDLLVVAFGRQHGKILIKVKGEKKIHSQFKGKMNIFNILNANIYDSGRSFTLTEAQLVKPGPDGTNLEYFQISQQISKILNQILQDQFPSSNIFQLVSETIQNPHQNLLEIFIIKLLHIEGYISPISPPEKIPEGKTLFFYVDKNGSINSTIDSQVDPNHLIPPKIIKAINFIIKAPIETCCKLKLTPEETEELQKTTKNLFQNNFQMELKPVTQIL